MDLIVVIPSRGRPGQAMALVDAIGRTAQANTFCVVAVDSDDPAAREYELACRGRGNAVVALDPEPAGHVGAINFGASVALDLSPSVKALAKLDDDHMPKQLGWDKLLLEQLGILGGGIVYGDDLLQGSRLPTAPVISARLVEALGWMALPALRHMYCDNVWLELGNAAGCLKYVPWVQIEHRHFLNGKAQVDETYALSNNDERYAVDGAAFQAWMADSLAADVAKVRAVLGKGD
jgi:hypothetical protein